MYFLFKFKADSKIPLPSLFCPALWSHFTILPGGVPKAPAAPSIPISYVLHVSLLSFTVEATMNNTRYGSYFKQRLAGFIVTNSRLEAERVSETSMAIRRGGKTRLLNAGAVLRPETAKRVP
jgi:hypothetical protein